MSTFSNPVHCFKDRFPLYSFFVYVHFTDISSNSGNLLETVISFYSPECNFRIPNI